MVWIHLPIEKDALNPLTTQKRIGNGKVPCPIEVLIPFRQIEKNFPDIFAWDSFHLTVVDTKETMKTHNNVLQMFNTPWN